MSVRASVALIGAVALCACRADLPARRCDPFRTPRLEATPIPAAEVKSAHAPFSAGDCTACHAPAPKAAEPSAGATLAVGPAFKPVTDHCHSCHGDMFRAPPKGHPPEGAFCFSCHNPHTSRQKSLLLDEDVSRPCFTSPPPVREKTAQKADDAKRP